MVDWVVFPLAKRIAAADSLAEDVLQTSWIKILQSINHACFDGPKACPRVHRIVTNAARNMAGKRGRRNELPLLERQNPTPGTVVPPELDHSATLRIFRELLSP